MNDKEKALWVREPDAKEADPMDFCGELCLFAENLIKEAKKPSWIPVADLLPEEDIKVLLLCKNKAMFVGVHGKYYYGTESRFKIFTALNSTKLLNKGRVTHWMPLPEPPEEE